MKNLSIDFYDTFECIGTECPDTCCANWHITVDAKTAAYYNSLDTAFGHYIQENLISYDDNAAKDNVQIQLKDSRCPFLTESNLCDIYIKLGADKICNTCKIYPRYTSRYGDINFCGLGISCPEVARLILTREVPISFGLLETDSKEDSSVDTDWELFNTFISCFTLSVNLLQNRSYSFHDRLVLFLLFNDNFQKYLDTSQDCQKLIDIFSTPASLDHMLLHAKNIRTNETYKVLLLSTLKKNIGAFSNAAYIKDYTDLISEHLANESYTSESTWNIFNTPKMNLLDEQYSVYYIFRRYMTAYNTLDVKKMISQFIYTYCLHHYFIVLLYEKNGKMPDLDEQIKLFSSMSRFLEHSSKDEDFELLYKMILSPDESNLVLLLSLI